MGPRKLFCVVMTLMLILLPAVDAASVSSGYAMIDSTPQNAQVVIDGRNLGIPTGPGPNMINRNLPAIFSIYHHSPMTSPIEKPF